MQLSAPSTPDLAMVPVRNPQPGPTVFSDEQNKIVITWEGAGTPGDIQLVPTALLSHPALADSIMKGVLAIDDRSTAMAALQESAAVWQTQQAQASAAAVTVMDTTRADDMLQVSCIGPGDRPGALCGVQAPQRQSQIGKVPPLCDRHQALKASFVPVEAQDPNTGLSTTAWTQVQTTARQTQLA